MKNLKLKITLILLAAVILALVVILQDTPEAKITALCIIVAVLLLIFALYKFGVYLFSPYFKSTKDSYFAVLFNKEKALRYKITKMYFKKFSNLKRCVCDVYMPKADGTTVKADMILLNETGIWVLDVKALSGKLQGNEPDPTWTFTKGKTTEEIPNPAVWNKLYMKWIKAYIKNYPQADCFSNVVCSNSCDIKNVKIKTNDVIVTKPSMLKKDIQRQLNRIGTSLAESEVMPIYELLMALRNEETAKNLTDVPGIQDTIFFERENRFEEVHAPEIGTV